MRPYRILQTDYPYHVTTRTNGRRFRLTRGTYAIVIRILNEMSRRFQVQVHHFQIMSNHYHMKISTPHANLSAAMCYLNGRLARLINRQQGTKGHLWEQRYHATFVTKDAYDAECVRYIYRNPVRAKVCQHPSESPFLSSFAFYARGKAIPINVTPDGFFLALGTTDADRQAAFRAFIDSPLPPQEVDRMRRMLRRPFYGSTEFIARMRTQYAKQLRIACSVRR